MNETQLASWQWRQETEGTLIASRRTVRRLRNILLTLLLAGLVTAFAVQSFRLQQASANAAVWENAAQGIALHHHQRAEVAP